MFKILSSIFKAKMSFMITKINITTLCVVGRFVILALEIADPIVTFL